MSNKPSRLILACIAVLILMSGPAIAETTIDEFAWDSRIYIPCAEEYADIIVSGFAIKAEDAESRVISSTVFGEGIGELSGNIYSLYRVHGDLPHHKDNDGWDFRTVMVLVGGNIMWQYDFLDEHIEGAPDPGYYSNAACTVL
jgi:hypothetical protein